jgi:predicted DNA-binding ribbon-helix-helix protein
MTSSNTLFPGPETTAERMRMRSRTVSLPDGRQLRIRLEASFWQGITEMLDREGLRLPELIVMVERMTGGASDEPIAPRLRCFVIQYFQYASLRPISTSVRTAPAEVILFDAFRRRRGRR